MSTMTLSPTFTSSTSTSSRASSTQPAGSVRLTRRGRLVVLVAALLVVLALGFALASHSAATERPGTAEPTRVIMVGSGDTLWDIAADIVPDGDVRSMMEEISHLNALDNSMLVAGQQLVVPTD